MLKIFLKEYPEHASLWALTGICLLVLKQRQLPAPMALWHALKDSTSVNRWLVYGCKVPVPFMLQRGKKNKETMHTTNNYTYVCIKIQFNLHAHKRNASVLCAVAVASAMWHGSRLPPAGKNKQDHGSSGTCKPLSKVKAERVCAASNNHAIFVAITSVRQKAKQFFCDTVCRDSLLLATNASWKCLSLKTTGHPVLILRE